MMVLMSMTPSKMNDCHVCTVLVEVAALLLVGLACFVVVEIDRYSNTLQCIATVARWCCNDCPNHDTRQ